MNNYFLEVFVSFFLGILLFLSVNGYGAIFSIFFKKIKFNYSINISIYFLISLLIFLIDKNYLIFFTIGSSFLFILANYSLFKKKYLFNISIFLILFSLILGQIIHGPTSKITAWGLHDTYYYVSLIYQDQINFPEVKINTLLELKTSVLSLLVTFLGNQFSNFIFFDPFKFISISIFTFSVISLAYESNRYKKKIGKNEYTIFLILIFFLVSSLPYPLYIFEATYFILALPIIPIFVNFVFNQPEKNYLHFFFITFSILITKVALLSILILLIVYEFCKDLKNIKTKVIILTIFLFAINFFLPVLEIQKAFFNKISFDILNINYNFNGFHKVLHLILIVIITIITKKKFFFLFVFPSLILFLFFPAASPAQLFYVIITIISIKFFTKEEIFTNTNIKIFFKKYFFFTIQILLTLSFIILKQDFLFYIFYIIFFILCLGNMLNRDNLISVFLCFVVSVSSILKFDFRQDNVLDYDQKDIYINIKKLTPKDSLIFSDLNISESKFNSPWGLFSSISERQFYFSSFYSDFLLKFENKKRREMYINNNKIINYNESPEKIIGGKKFSSYYILTSQEKINNKSAILIYKNKSFKLYKIN